MYTKEDEQTTSTQNHMVNSHKDKVEKKKPDIKEYVF